MGEVDLLPPASPAKIPTPVPTAAPAPLVVVVSPVDPGGPLALLK